MNSCAGADASLPKEILEEIRKHIKATKPQRTHLDAMDCCLLEDLGGIRCPGKTCRLNSPDGTKIDPHDNKPIGTPIT